MTLVEDCIESDERFSMCRIMGFYTSAFVTQSSSHASGTAPDFPIAQDHMGGNGTISEWLEICMLWIMYPI